MAKYHYTIDYKGKKSQSSGNNGVRKVGRALIGVTAIGIFGYVVYLNWDTIINAFNGLTSYLENNLSSSSAFGSSIPPSNAALGNTGAASVYSGTAANDSSFFSFAQSQSWYPYIAQFATQYNVPQSIILGVIDQESGGNSNSQSSAGAMGLMQIMPATAQQVASANGISYMGSSDLLNPVINIQIGTAYLSSLNSQFNNWTTSLNAYFAGAGNAYNTYQATPHPQTANMPAGSTYGQQVVIRANNINNDMSSSGSLLAYLGSATGGTL